MRDIDNALIRYRSEQNKRYCTHVIKQLGYIAKQGVKSGNNIGERRKRIDSSRGADF